jgi:hypothetical protein
MGQFHICTQRKKLIKIKKLFKDYNINISFCTRKTLESFLSSQKSNRNFKIRYKENIQDIRNNKDKTGFSYHILNTGHSYDKLENTLKIFNIQEKGPYLNMLEKFHIHKTKKTSLLLNDNYADIYNPIYKLLF